MCPDYNVNGLETCKHIEAVLSHVRKSHARLVKDDAPSSRIEIYLSRRGTPEIRVACPKVVPLSARRLTAGFFSSAGTLLGEPMAAFSALRWAITTAPPRSRAAF
jgi:hypothetical protein